MKRSYFTGLIILIVALAASAEPYCRIKRYDESDGLSERRVKQIVQDCDGVLWFATWNGLNRFDGYGFERIRPHIDDEVRAFSERFGDLKLTAAGDLWCRVDDRILLFDLDSYRFRDISSRLEKKFGKSLEVKQIMTTHDGRTVINCAEDGFVVLADSLPVESARLVSSKPDFDYVSPGNRKLGDLPPYKHEDLIYSRTDSLGSVWAITKDGKILWATSLGCELKIVTVIDSSGDTFFYSTADSQGNVWVRSAGGAYCLTMGHLPYSEIPGLEHSIMRASFLDSRGRVWVSMSDVDAVACYYDLSSPPKYLAPDGTLHDYFVKFGSKIYSIGGDASSSLWLGSKPDGVFRLIEKGEGRFEIENYRRGEGVLQLAEAPMDNCVYDIVDAGGRTWLATLHGGIDYAVQAADGSVQFRHLSQSPDYPVGAMHVRRLTVIDDTMMVAATTKGMLVFRLPDCDEEIDSVSFTFHVSEPGRESALGNIATMHVVSDKEGRIFVATESDGVNMLLPESALTDTLAEFRHFNSRAGMPNDVAYALACDKTDGTIWVVSGNVLYNINQKTNKMRAYPAYFWNERMHFSDARPLNLSDNNWLIGLEDGAAIFDFDKMPRKEFALAPVFTSVSVQNRPDSLISVRSDTIVLGPDERNVTVSFASLAYGFTENIHYSFNFDGGGWNNLGASRAVTLLDLSPGTYDLKVRSSDGVGLETENIRTLTIIVTPSPWETPVAYVLYFIAIIGIIAGLIYTIIYIRRIKRKQHELLDAYMALVEQYAVTDKNEAKVSVEPVKSLNESDSAFMDKVLEFVNENIGDPDAGIEEMAGAVAMSRSSLNRKMKSLLGVTPADFFKESRLKRAATLLAETDSSITDIAIECGFSDINYFGKCFKASRKMSPTVFRKNHRV